MTDHLRIDRARRLLALPEEATLREIKVSYRQLALKYHPDRCPGDARKISEEKFKELAQAYDALMDYCAGYRFSFRQEDVDENLPDREMREHMRRFYEDFL